MQWYGYLLIVLAVLVLAGLAAPLAAPVAGAWSAALPLPAIG